MLSLIVSFTALKALLLAECVQGLAYDTAARDLIALPYVGEEEVNTNTVADEGSENEGEQEPALRVSRPRTAREAGCQSRRMCRQQCPRSCTRACPRSSACLPDCRIHHILGQDCDECGSPHHSHHSRASECRRRCTVWCYARCDAECPPCVWDCRVYTYVGLECEEC